MSNTELMIANVALKKMFRGEYFDVCTVRDVCKVLNVPFSKGADHDKLTALHCVHFSEMTVSLRNDLVETVKRVVGQEAFDPMPDCQPQNKNLGEIVDKQIFSSGGFVSAVRTFLIGR